MKESHVTAKLRPSTRVGRTLLSLLVEDVTGAAATLYQGAPAAFTSVAAGSIDPGVTGAYRLTLAYPSAAADPVLQGATMALRLQFTGRTP
jgi:hypothetical protein